MIDVTTQREILAVWRWWKLRNMKYSPKEEVSEKIAEELHGV
jgi:hypothetical protein